jgi:hypothetical protein
MASPSSLKSRALKPNLCPSWVANYLQFPRQPLGFPVGALVLSDRRADLAVGDICAVKLGVDIKTAGIDDVDDLGEPPQAEYQL